MAQFFADAEAFVGWHGEGGGRRGERAARSATPRRALRRLSAVRGKIDDYFARCRLAAFDARALAALNREEKEYLALAAKDLTITLDELPGFPLASVDAGQPLPLTEGAEPGVGRRGRHLRRRRSWRRCSGEKTSLTEAEWATLTAQLRGPRRLARRQGRARPWRSSGCRASGRSWRRHGASATLARSSRRTRPSRSKRQRDRCGGAAPRYHRDLRRLLEQLRELPGLLRRAPTGRSSRPARCTSTSARCELCLRVDDAGRHATWRRMAKTYPRLLRLHAAGARREDDASSRRSRTATPTT